MIKKNEKKTALKLLDKYADEYNDLQKRTKELLKENQDLKSNLRINKDIIDSFFKSISLDSKMKSIIKGLKNEINLLSSNLQSSQSKVKDLFVEISELKQTLSKNSVIYSQESDKLKSEIFCLQNIIIQKDNLFRSIKPKTHSITPNTSLQDPLFKNPLGNNNGSIREIYVTSPTPIINKINDELYIVKEVNKKLTNHIKILKASLQKYESLLQKYENDIGKYKEEIASLKQNNSNNKIISKLGYQNFINAHKNGNSSGSYFVNNNNTNSSKKLNGSIKNERCKTELFSNSTSSNSNTLLKKSMISNLEEVNKSKQKMNSINLTEEWIDTLKFCNLTQEEYLYYCASKKTSKLTDAIEFLYKIIVEKNIQISLLTNDNDCINSENIKLNKLNIELTEELAKIKSRNTLNSINKSLINKTDTKDSSVFVNTDINEVFQRYPKLAIGDFSLTSSEFREGMIVDQFEIDSKLSKVKNTQ